MPSRVRVDRSLFANLAREVDRAVTTGARPVVAKLAATIASSSGPSAYRAVYRRLATGVDLKSVPDQPPSITISGQGGFSGGGTITSLVGPYEYGNPSGDTARAARGKTRRKRRRGSQFPPRKSSGHWVGPAIEAGTPRLVEGFADLVNKATAQTRGGVR